MLHLHVDAGHPNSGHNPGCPGGQFTLSLAFFIEELAVSSRDFLNRRLRWIIRKTTLSLRVLITLKSRLLGRNTPSRPAARGRVL